MNSHTIKDSGVTEIVIFTRYPEAGTTKTRLIPSLGPENAARLQRAMTEKLLTAIEAMPLSRGCRLKICFTGGTRAQMKQWLGDHPFEEQQGCDLGEKMEHAFQESFNNGAEQVVLVGSDIPSIDTDLMSLAVTLVTKEELVIGPTFDGGYYMIGFNRKCAAALYPEIFHDIPWSNANVLASTIDTVTTLGLSYKLLPKHHDIDTPEDLPYAEKWQLL